MTENTNLPALPVWQEVEIANTYNSRRELAQITRWSTDPERHPQRTPKYIQAARTTWRWGCSIVAGTLLLCCASGLVALTTGSPAPLADLAAVLLSGGASALPLGWRELVPDWYVRAVAGMVGGDPK